MELKAVTVFVNPEEWTELREIAEIRGMNRSSFVRLLLHEGLIRARAQERQERIEMSGSPKRTRRP